ncbi:hypothetical protein [Arthrobacter sp. HY1533]|uniref:hypothetical protein n=1 Tax=Arthrobacter sp. HY1533 TaxID=2970919 RepID=UPI0022BA0F60|nr:hypothetical protein [Arthrobacter sp. HY1533]
MSLEAEIHQLVLGMDGVAAVYAADPVWLTAVKQLGSLLGPGEAAPVPFVVCSEEADDAGVPGAAPAMSVRVRIGTDGSLPAPGLARAVAAGIRTHVAVQRPGVEVKAVVEISAIGV